jgi:hypothetical protein
MPRPQLPPSDDPKVQAQREKAREYAKKKKEEEAKQERQEHIKINQELKRKIKEVKASSTINQAIKMKIARKKLAEAKPPAKPAKKPDDNPFHNLPEDIQRRIMELAKDKGGWNYSVIDIIDDDKIPKDTPERDMARGLYSMLIDGENLINKVYDGWSADTYEDGANEPEYEKANAGMENIIKQYGEKDKSAKADALITSLNVRWVDYKNADKGLKSKMLEVREIRKANFVRVINGSWWNWQENKALRDRKVKEMKKWDRVSPFFAMQVLDNKGNPVSPTYIYDGIGGMDDNNRHNVIGYGINLSFGIITLAPVIKMGSKNYWDSVKKKEKKIEKAKAKR